MLLVALPLTAVHARAEEPPPAAAPAPVDATSAIRKWIETVDADWQKTYAKEVAAPAQEAKAQLAQQYVATVEVNFARATKAGDLDTALAWQNERDAFNAGKTVPAQDEANTPAELKKARTAWRAETARIEKDEAARSRAVQARYDEVLAGAQTQLTQRQRIEEALVVKKKREEVAAAWAPPLAPGANPGPAQPSAPAAQQPRLSPDVSTQRFATVEVQGGQMVKLAKDEKLWTDRPVKLTAIPARYAGFKFTQLPAHSTTLRFKVLSDGLVAIGCSARWASTADAEAAKDFMTEEKLLAAGWVRQKQDQIATTAQDMQFNIYARHCKAGEEFAYRTEKYAPPILLTR